MTMYFDFSVIDIVCFSADYLSKKVMTIVLLIFQAATEKLHAIVRSKTWGYNPDENMEAADMHKIKYEVGAFFMYCIKVFF